ncbi:MAG: hypothetical protein EXR73_04310 [Myxococcales bacterium]|nr:hypothetical protein [Myxococcales bacterium]
MSETVEGRLGDFLGRPATAKAERVAEKPAKAAKPVAGEKLKARDLGKGPGLRTGQIFTF